MRKVRLCAEFVRDVCSAGLCARCIERVIRRVLRRVLMVRVLRAVCR